MKAEELRNSNDIRNMEDYEIDELLDKVIDDLNC